MGLPSVLSKRSADFGYSERTFQKGLPGFDTPDPTKYYGSLINDKAKLELNKGKTFGISRSHYDNVYYPNQRNLSPKAASQMPSSSQYSPLISVPFGADGKKFAIKSRVPPLDPTTKEYPGPGMYKPIHILTEPSRYNSVGFGTGNRGSPVGLTSKIGLNNRLYDKSRSRCI